MVVYIVPPYSRFHLHFELLVVNSHLKADDLLPMRGLVNSCLMLLHNPYVIHLTPSHHLGILASHLIRMRRRVQYNKVF